MSFHPSAHPDLIESACAAALRDQAYRLVLPACCLALAIGDNRIAGSCSRY
jgi:hypothetical protein